MDALDVRILRAMSVVPYALEPQGPDALRPARVAEAVGTTVDTVKARLARMEEDGVIAGYGVYPNLRHLDMGATAYFAHVPDDGAKDEAVRRVAELDGILEVHDYLGPGVCVDFAYGSKSAHDATLAALHAVVADATVHRFYDRVMPTVDRALTPLDWRIVRALRRSPRATAPRIARDVGVSARTVRRRVERLEREGSIFAIPLLDPARASGVLLVELLFYLRDGAGRDVAGDILREFDEHRVYAYVPASRALGAFNVLAFARTPREVDELRRRGSSLHGVARAEAWLFRAFHDRSAWIDRAIDARAGASS